MAHELKGSPPRGACAHSTGPRESTHTCRPNRKCGGAPPPFVSVCARVCACVCACVSLSLSLSAAPLLPPTGPADPAAPGRRLQLGPRSQGPQSGHPGVAVSTGDGCPQPCAQTQTTRDGGRRADTRTEEPLAPEASDDTEPLDICGTKPLPAGMRDGCLKGLGGEHACAPMGTPVAILMAFGRRPPPPHPFAPPSTGGAIVRAHGWAGANGRTREMCSFIQEVCVSISNTTLEA
jgi:hypothetical protein